MIRQMKSGGTWYYQFIMDGKRYNGVCEGAHTKRDAEAYEKKIRETAEKAAAQNTVTALVENFRDELTGGKKIELSDAFDRYLKKPAKRIPSKDQTARNRTYWNDFVSFMEATFPDIKVLANVTKHHAEEYIALIRTSGAFNKGISFSRDGHTSTYASKDTRLSPRTINARHKAIKAVFSRLMEDAGLIANPFDIPTMDNDTTSREAFTQEEQTRIGDNMTMPYTRPVFVIGLCTGQTLGDICLLKWTEIVGNWITNKKRRKTGVSLDIPILPPLAAFLEEQRPMTGSGEYVCPELAEMYLQNPSGVVYRVREFLENIGIHTAMKTEDRTRAVSTKAAHAMRHTFAYLAGVYNIPLTIVQGVLGHMSPEMTAHYQQHAQREQKEKFFRQMPNVLGVATGSQDTETARMLNAPEDSAERAELRRLAGTLPLETVKEILDFLNKRA